MPRKKPSQKTVAVIFTVPASVKAALTKKVKAGQRSKFVAGLLAEKLGVKIDSSAPPAKKRSVLGSFLRRS